jgi:phage/plasmid-like protein (TIGR03299 family)
MNQQMINDFADQTGRVGDAAEYADPSRSRVETMFYTGADPWHRIGTKLDNPATAEEAITAAGLDWEVEPVPTFIMGAEETHGSTHRIPTGGYAIVRKDNGTIFTSGLSSRYQPLQNSDAFKFFDAVVGAGEAIYHTAGSLNNGRIVWILAKMNGDLGLEGDAAEKYIMLSNSHDGTRAIDMRFCVKRVVCMNTFKMAMGGNELNTRLRHTGNVMNKVNQTRDLLGLGDAYFANFMNGMNRLVETKLSDNLVEKYFEDVVAFNPKNPDAEVTTRKRAIVDEIIGLYHGGGRGSDLVTARGTAWGAFNAVSQYLEHERPIRGFDEDDIRSTDKRLSSSFFGRGARIESRAWNKALSLA